MILCDSHTHNSFSSDSNTPMEEMILAAIDRKLTSICITDHIDIDFPAEKYGMDFLFDLDEYISHINKLKNKYRQQLNIITGIELGILPSIHDKLAKLMDTYGKYFDFVIASTHLIDMMDPYEPEYFDTYSETQGIENYFLANLENMKTFLDFDVYGHLDYVVRYAPNKEINYHPSDYMDLIDETLRFLIEHGKGIECNTAGFKAGLSFPHPHEIILKRYRELGGEILTIGSDAHSTEYVGYQFEKAAQILKNCGFKYYTVFSKRTPHMYPLD